MDRPLSPHDVDVAIMAISDELETETTTYAKLEEEAANAEATYKGDFARSFVTAGAMVDGASGRRIAASLAEAHAEAGTTDAMRMWKIADARRRASKEALLSLRARLDAMRTLSANLRAQT